MKIEFDPAKDARNIELRGISLEEATRFEWESAVVIQDTRQQLLKSVGLSRKTGGNFLAQHADVVAKLKLHARETDRRVRDLHFGHPPRIHDARRALPNRVVGLV